MYIHIQSVTAVKDQGQITLLTVCWSKVPNFIATFSKSVILVFSANPPYGDSYISPVHFAYRNINAYLIFNLSSCSYVTNSNMSLNVYCSFKIWKEMEIMVTMMHRLICNKVCKVYQNSWILLYSYPCVLSQCTTYCPRHWGWHLDCCPTLEGKASSLRCCPWIIRYNSLLTSYSCNIKYFYFLIQVLQRFLLLFASFT